jgi:lipopolysaccharide transport system permease protein
MPDGDQGTRGVHRSVAYDGYRRRHHPMSEATGITAQQVSVSAADAAPSAQAQEEILIRPRRGWIGIDWQEMFRHRELLYFLVWRDFKVRYKQTVLGIAWAVLQPVFMMLVFTVIFGILLGTPSDGLPYPVFAYAALVPFTYFSTAVNLSGQSLVSQQQLLTKIYFPRLFVPAASVGAGLVDLLVAFAVYGIILAIYQIMPSWQIVFLPFFIVLTVMVTLGFGYLLAALTVTYRDFRYVIPFSLQAMMYISPVVWPVSKVPENYQWLLGLNPLAGIIHGFRCSILGNPWNLWLVGLSTAVTIALFVFSLYFFRKTERRFADIA